MSTLFRVEHPTSGVGLWYREDGEGHEALGHAVTPRASQGIWRRATTSSRRKTGWS